MHYRIAHDRLVFELLGHESSLIEACNDVDVTNVFYCHSLIPVAVISDLIFSGVKHSRLHAARYGNHFDDRMISVNWGTLMLYPAFSQSKQNRPPFSL